MSKFRFQSLIGVGFILLFGLNITFLLAGVITQTPWLIVAAIILSVVQFVLHDVCSTRHPISRPFSFKERLKYRLGKIRPLVSKVLLKDDSLRTMVSPEEYELIVCRAYNIPTDVVRNSLSFPDLEGIKDMHTRIPGDFMAADLKVQIGTDQCRQPYTLSILNVGGPDQKSVSNATILALSEGANIRGCAINTGNGGIRPALIRGGGDLIWQIAHEDDAFRNADRSFNEKVFQVTATRPYIKMIEIVFPRHELSVMKRLAGDRMMFFFERLRDLSAGKPVGIRLFNPGREVIDRLCKSMRETQVHLDFITIDGTALSGSDSFGGGSASNASFFGSLTGARRALNDYGLPTKIMVSENIVSEYEILRSVALGASACYCTAPMVLAANSGSGLAIPNAVGRRLRVANFHRNTVHATLSLMKLCGYDTLEDVNPDDFCRKTSRFEIQTLKEIYFDNSPKNEPHRFSHLS